MGEQLYRMNVCVAIHHTARHRRARFRTGRRCRASALDCPAHQRHIAHKPRHQGDQQPQIGIGQHDGRRDQGGRGKSHRIKHLKHRIPCRRGSLHDAVGDAAREIAFKPAHGLAQHMGVRAPAHHRAKVGQDRIVQQRHIRAADDRADQHDGQGHQDNLCPMRRPNGSRGALAEQVNQMAQIPQQPHLRRRIQR